MMCDDHMCIFCGVKQSMTGAYRVLGLSVPFHDLPPSTWGRHQGLLERVYLLRMRTDALAPSGPPPRAYLAGIC